MSDRTAQCEECTTVFPCNPTGRLPKLCPGCKGGEAERASEKRSARKPRKVAARSDNGSSSPAIATAIFALQEEIGELEEQLSVRREALAALEKVA